MARNRLLLLLAASCFSCIIWPPPLLADSGKTTDKEASPKSDRIVRQQLATTNGSSPSGNPDLATLLARYHLKTAKAIRNATDGALNRSHVPVLSSADFAKRYLTTRGKQAAAGGDLSSAAKPDVRRSNESQTEFAKRYLTRMQAVAGGDDEYAVQYEIFVYRNYNGMAAPSNAQVQVQVQPLQLQLAKSEQHQDGVSAQVALTLVWQDSRLRFSHPNVTQVLVYTHFMEKLWRPLVQFDSHGPVSRLMAIIRGDGRVSLTQRMTVSLACVGQLHLLPLDRTKCEATLCNLRALESQQQLEWLPSKTTNWPVASQFGDSTLADVQFLGQSRTAAVGTGGGCLTLQLKLKRRLALFLCAAYAPGALIAMLAACGLRAARPGLCAACAAAAFGLWLLAQLRYPQAPVDSLLSAWLLGCCGLAMSAVFAAFAASLPSRRRPMSSCDSEESTPPPPKDSGGGVDVAESLLVRQRKQGQPAAAAAASFGGRRSCIRTGLLTLYIAACVAGLALYAAAAVKRWTSAGAE